MTALAAGGLLVLAILDGAFSGFRASVGRTGLIDHRAADWLAARRGVALALFALSPVIAGLCADVAAGPTAWPSTPGPAGRWSRLTVATASSSSGRSPAT